MPDPIDPEHVRQVGRWSVRRLIGTGGFAWVFEVFDARLEVARALKMLQPQAAQGDQFKRFWREAKLLAALDHPNLVTIYELDQDPATGCHYYVMELLQGRTLAHTLKAEPGNRLEWRRASEIFRGVLHGLARLHDARIIHRDIKPQNIQLTDAAVPKLLDLGIARIQRTRDETVQETVLTADRSFIGTPRYASPEQLQAEDLTAASDVFSLALCFYEALAGCHLYDGIRGQDLRTFQSIYRYIIVSEQRQAGLEVAFPRRLRVPAALERVLAEALRFQPAKRHADARAMSSALEEALAEVDTGGQRRTLRPRPGPTGEKAFAGAHPPRRGFGSSAAERVQAFVAAAVDRLRARRRAILLATSLLVVGALSAAGWHFVANARLGSSARSARDVAERARADAEGGPLAVAEFDAGVRTATLAFARGNEALARGDFERAKVAFDEAARSFAGVGALRMTEPKRRSVQALGEDLARLVAAGEVDAETIAGFASERARADAAWSRASYEEAGESYQSAASVANRIISRVAETKAVARDAIDRYRQALESRTLEAVERVWKLDSLQRRRLGEFFHAASEVEVEVSIGRVVPSGDAIRVDFDQRIRAKGVERSDPGAIPMHARLERDAEGSWMISHLEAEY